MNQWIKGIMHFLLAYDKNIAPLPWWLCPYQFYLADRRTDVSTTFIAY